MKNIRTELCEHKQTKMCRNLENSLTVPEDEVDGSLYRALPEVMPPLIIPQRVLHPEKPDLIEVQLVTTDQGCNRRHYRLPIPWVVVRVLFGETNIKQ